MPVSAAETKAPQNPVLRKHIQVVEAPVTATTACAGLPTRSEIARVVLATLERHRTEFTIPLTLDIAGPGAPPDPSAIKVAVSVQVKVGPDALGKSLAQSVETQIGFWATPEPVAPLMGRMLTASAQRPCDEGLGTSIIANSEHLVQWFAQEVAALQRSAAPK